MLVNSLEIRCYRNLHKVIFPQTYVYVRICIRHGMGISNYLKYTWPDANRLWFICLSGLPAKQRYRILCHPSPYTYIYSYQEEEAVAMCQPALILQCQQESLSVSVHRIICQRLVSLIGGPDLRLASKPYSSRMDERRAISL